MTDSITRRTLFKAAGGASVVALVPAAPAEAQTPAQAPQAPDHSNAPAPSSMQQPGGDVLFFFNQEEARFMRAAVDRIIPDDEHFQGAGWAGVVDYIDRQLAGAYGAGVRLFLRGPWQLGEPNQGYQLRFTPAELYRLGIAEVRDHARKTYHDKEFWDVGESAMDDVLRGLESGNVNLPSMPGTVFFETLLANTIEGYFADPVYGGNRDMVSWRMIGFPGAYAQYHALVEEYDRAFDRPPMSLAQAALSSDQHGEHKH